jgi:DNA helicase-2/ATP-dependent DNA helicase PcrA
VRFVADLHIHSYLSRATSKELNLEQLHRWAQRKGIAVVATGDFTHPRWFAELRDKLVPAGDGLFALREDLARAADVDVPAACRAPVRFMLSVEVSSIYSRGDRVRKVHNLIYAPDFESAARLSSRLARIGNIESDGRPILGVDSRDLLEITLASSPDAFLIPAHIWTPWFSALGSQSGFDSMAECFADLAPHIFAVETGLSSDPAMNWRLSALDRYALVSSSDAHSPEKLGREANLFDCDLSYFAMRDALRERGAGFLGTLEFFPEEGKYHADGHRKCDVVMTPDEAAACDRICPRCGKSLTGGVLGRVAALADRPEGFRPEGAKPFASLVPLVEVLGEVLGVGAGSKRVSSAWQQLVSRVGPELTVLQDAPLEDVGREGPPLLAEALRRMRAGEVRLQAGYDGEYGIVRMFGEEERLRLLAQTAFFFGGTAVAPAEKTKTEPAMRPASEEVPTASATGPNLEQDAAIDHADGPLLIVAGPGTGKTRTLVERIARLVRTRAAAPDEITAITFTRKAATELRERLAKLGARAGGVSVQTFHALGLDLLRAHAAAAGLPPHFAILDEAGRQALLAQVHTEAGECALSVARTASAISAAKAALVAPEAATPVYAAYERALADSGALDFDDLVARAVWLLETDEAALAFARGRCRHLLVDEYQDINAAQYRLVRLLAPSGPSTNLCAVGDPDQAIYGFRGSDPSYFARFASDYPGARTLTLGRNYRSVASVVRLATAIIERTPGRVPRALQPLAARGNKILRQVLADERAEADFIAAEIEAQVAGTSFLSMDAGRAADGHGLAFHEIAVLVRLSAQADAIEEALDRSGIPCHRRGDDAFSARPHVADILAKLRRHVDAAKAKPKTVADLLATLVPDAKLDQRCLRALELLQAFAVPFAADAASFLSEMALARETDLQYLPQKVALLTLHASKGLEFPLVFIAGCEDGILPLRLPWLPPADLEEERRLLYVGMTRAQQRLILTAAHHRSLAGRTVENRPCPFLDDVPADLLTTSRSAPRRRKAHQLSLLKS